MAEFKEVAKQYLRMCNSFNHCGYYHCNECPLNSVRSKDNTCAYWAFITDPETSEKVIVNWAKKNPVMTNRDKFKEVFGFDPYSKTVFEKIWFEDDYKEPIKED